MPLSYLKEGHTRKCRFLLLINYDPAPRIDGIPWIGWCRNCRDVAVVASVARYGLCCGGGFGRIGVAIVVADWVSGSCSGVQLLSRVDAEVGGDIVDMELFVAAPDGVIVHSECCWKCCIFFSSLSFCVSANLTTSGAEQPSIVWLWWRDWKGEKKMSFFRSEKGDNWTIRQHETLSRLGAVNGSRVTRFVRDMPRLLWLKHKIIYRPIERILWRSCSGAPPYGRMCCVLFLRRIEAIEKFMNLRNDDDGGRQIRICLGS